MSVTTHHGAATTGNEQPQTTDEREAVAYVDAVFHDQHGDSARWDCFEREAYHRLVASTINRVRKGKNWR